MFFKSVGFCFIILAFIYYLRMQNQIKKSLPPFISITSKPILFFNIIFGLFGICFLFFFLAGMIFIIAYSHQETGLDEIATVALFLICLFAFVSFLSLVIYYRKRMYTTTIIDEKGIRYLNKFSNRIIKDLPWKLIVLIIVNADKFNFL